MNPSSSSASRRSAGTRLPGSASAVSTVRTADSKEEFQADAGKKSVIKPKAEKKAEEPAAEVEAEADVVEADAAASDAE